MKNSRIPLALLACFGLSALTVHAEQAAQPAAQADQPAAQTDQSDQPAQLASAKVLSVSGIVTHHTLDGQESPLEVSEILKQGDTVLTSALSNALLVFSNGSEIVVEENSSFTLTELSQDAFAGDKHYEQLKADPSKSQALLDLNYGKVSGHVKALRPGSEFLVQTPLGTAAIRGTQFTVETRFNAERGEYLLFITNSDGLVDIISRYAGNLDFGSGTTADKGYNHGADSDKSDPLPPGHTIVLRFSQDDPSFHDVIKDFNLPPFQNPDTRPDTTRRKTVTNPDAEDVQEVSPSGI